MAVEKNLQAFPYRSFRGTWEEYQLFLWKQTHYHDNTYEQEICLSKKATNPPKIYDSRTSFVTLSLYSDDGVFIIPPSMLPDGVVSGTQERTLYGITCTP
jgi:hypothetical protein